jgi:hypothetical protein
MRCVSFLFEQGCPEQRPRGAGGAALVVIFLRQELPVAVP